MNIRKTDMLRALPGLLLWFLAPVLQAQLTEGVGINTENIQGVFHIDAAGNNLASESIPSAQQADDVVVSAEGYVGIGTAAPTAQLHIHTQNLPGVFPLRLADGAGAGKMLTSDEEGNASWKMPPTPPSSKLYLPMGTAPRGEAYPLGNTTQITNSTFSVPEDGFYSVDLRFWAEWWFGNNSPTTSFIQTATRFQLVRKTGNVYRVVDEYQYNELSYTRVTTFVTLYAPASTGDELSIRVNPVAGANLTSNPAGHSHTQINMLYKKLGVDDSTHYFD
jgi:hypothetical protein